MSNFNKGWYILITKPGCEKKVSGLLTRKNVPHYLPLKREWTSKKKLTSEPLFDSFVFVQIENSEFSKCRSIDGVINFAYWLGKPAQVQNEEIDVIKRFVNEYSNIKLEKIPLGVNGTVRIMGSQPAEHKGHMVSVKNNIVRIILSSLGYIMTAEMGKPLIEIIPSSHTFGLLEKFRSLNMTS